MATRHISHLKSNALNASNDGPKLPISGANGDLVFGEIAINYKKGYETIAILNDTSGITKFTNDVTMLGNMDLKDQAASAVTFNAAKAAAVSSAITKVTGSTVLLNLSDVNATGRTLSAEVSSKVVTKTNDDQGVFTDGNVILGAGNNHIKDSMFNINTFVRKRATGTTLDANKIIMGGGNNIVSASSYSVSTDMPTNTTSAETLVPSSKAVAQAIEESFKAQDAMRYKGTVANVTDFNTSCKNPEVGDTWKVSSGFTIDEVRLEPGDMLISHISKSGESTANISNFDAIQANLDPNLYALKTDIIKATSDDDVVNISLGGSNVGLSGYTLTASHKTAHTASGQTTPNTAQTLEKGGGTVNVPVIKFDKYGHVTATTTTTIKLADNIAVLAQSTSYVQDENIVVGAGNTTGGGGIKDSSISVNSVVTASNNLATDKIIVGNANNKTIKASNYGVTTSSPTSTSDNTTIPTSKAVYSAITANSISSVSASAPLSSSTSNGAVTISHNNSGVSGGTYGGKGTMTTITGGTFNVPKIEVNDTGHITSASNFKYTTPNSYGGITVYNSGYISASSYNDSATFIDGDGISMEVGDIDVGPSTVYGIKFSVTDIVCGDY